MNILRQRLNKSILNNENEFAYKVNQTIRKGKNILEKREFKYKEFNFNGNLHSEKIEEEKFTNYLKSYENKLFKLLNEIFDKLYFGNYSFLEEFELDLYEAYEESFESKRLRRIVMKINNMKNEEEIPKILYKFKPTKKEREKNKWYNGIRLYVSADTDGSIKLYLIDIYHLAINAFNSKTKKYELDEHYKNAENYKKCISIISDKYYN